MAAAAPTLEQFKSVVASRLQLPSESLFGHRLRLAEVVSRSPVTTNSIDLMEAVAGAMAELDLDDRLELPAMTLNNTIDELIAEVGAQLVAK